MITGRNASTGPAGPGRAARSPSPIGRHPRSRRRTPRPPAGSSPRRWRAPAGCGTRRSSSRKPRPTITARNSGSLPVSTSAKSSEDRRGAARRTPSGRCRRVGGGDHVGAQPADQFPVGFGCGGGGRDRPDDAQRWPGGCGAAAHWRPPLSSVSGSGPVPRGAPGRRPGRVCATSSSGAVEAGPESLGEQVVRLAGGARDGLLPGVGGPRRSENTGIASTPHHQRWPRRPAARGRRCDEARTSGPRIRSWPSLRGPSAASRAPLASAQHPDAQEAEHGREQGDGGAMVNSTVMAAAMPSPVRKLMSRTSSPSRAMHDGGAGEQHRASGGVDRLTAASSGVMPGPHAGRGAG